MPFVRRDSGGKIDAVATVNQPGWDSEELAENHPDVVVFRAPKVDAPGDRVERGIANNPTIDALVDYIAEKDGITKRVLINKLRAREQARGGRGA